MGMTVVTPTSLDCHEEQRRGQEKKPARKHKGTQCGARAPLLLEGPCRAEQHRGQSETTVQANKGKREVEVGQGQVPFIPLSEQYTCHLLVCCSPIH